MLSVLFVLAQITAKPLPRYTLVPPAMYFVLTVDDNDSSYAESMAAVIETAGGKLTWFSNQGTMTAQDRLVAAALSASGHEVSNHTWSHWKQDITTPISVTSTNTNPTAAVDASAKSLVLSCDEVGNRVTVSWAVEDKTLADAQAAVVGKGWTLTQNPSVSTSLKLASLASTAGGQAVPVGLLADTAAPDSAMWREEIADNATSIGALTGRTPNTFAWPGGVVTTGARSYLKDTLGAIGSRGIAPGVNYFQAVEVFNTKSLLATVIRGDGSEAGVRASAQSYYAGCAESNGCLFVIYVHNAVEGPVNQMTWFVDEIVTLGGGWTTFGDALGTIRKTLLTDDGLTYYKKRTAP